MEQGRTALMLDLEADELSRDEATLLTDPRIVGIILFSRNYRDPAQLCALVDSVRAIREDLLIAVDQEGGRVQRLREGFTRLPPLRSLGERMKRDEEAALALARDHGWLMAREVLECGVDFSFAPVLDLDTGISEVIGDRAFSDRPDQLIRLALAYIDGMHEAGMAAVGKHFPGHGSVAADSHIDIPLDERSLDRIRAQDMAIFSECLPILDAIMPAHVIYPALDATPAGFSAPWLQDVLRGELGFAGLIFSDDLCMAAAADIGDMPARVRAATDAGCEVLLVCNDRAAALEALACLSVPSAAAQERFGSMRGRLDQSGSEPQLVRQRKRRARESLQQLSGMDRAGGR